MLRNEGERLRTTVVCTPREDYFRVDDLKAHNITEISNPDQTRLQHDRLKSVMKKFGVEVIDIPELRGHPNSVFTRDVSLSTPQGYIELRMGLEARRGEEAWMARILDSLGMPLSSPRGRYECLGAGENSLL